MAEGVLTRAEILFIFRKNNLSLNFNKLLIKRNNYLVVTCYLKKYFIHLKIKKNKLIKR